MLNVLLSLLSKSNVLQRKIKGEFHCFAKKLWIILAVIGETYLPLPIAGMANDFRFF
jgi:hypothetical protein